MSPLLQVESVLLFISFNKYENKLSFGNSYDTNTHEKHLKNTFKKLWNMADS